MLGVLKPRAGRAVTAAVNRAVTVKTIMAEEAPAQPGHSRKVSQSYGTDLDTKWTKKPQKRPENRAGWWGGELIVPKGGSEALQSGQAEDRLQKACWMER